LPVRAVAEALGLDVRWDGSTNTVFLNSNVNEDTPQAETPKTDTPISNVGLNLSLTVTETTFIFNSHILSQGSLVNDGSMRITTDGVLQRQVRVVEGWTAHTVWEDIDTDVRSLYVFYGATFYIKNDNKLWGFGSNAHGLLGDGTGVNRAEPVHILDDVAMVTHGIPGIGTSGSEMFAITTDRTLKVWGNGNFSPITIMNDVVDVQMVFARNSHALNFGSNIIVRTSDGHIHQRKRDNSLTKISNEPVLYAHVDFESIRSSTLYLTHYINSGRSLMRRNEDRVYVEIATDVVFDTLLDHDTLFIKSDGSLWGWGDNVVSLAFEYSISFAVKADGGLWAWGRNTNWLLSSEHDSDYIMQPTEIMRDVTAVSIAGLNAVFVIRGDGSLWSWGTK
jgi:hypothetical protein